MRTDLVTVERLFGNGFGTKQRQVVDDQLLFFCNLSFRS